MKSFFWKKAVLLGLTSSSLYGKSIALPEGKTLPENLWRFRSVYKYAYGDKGFDSSGSYKSMGFSGQGHGAGFVLEYGLTDKMSLQILAPYVLQQSVALDGSEFKKTQIYQEKYEKALNFVAEKLKEEGLCDQTLQCKNLIQSGFKLPLGKTVTLPETGEEINISSEEEINFFIERMILNGAAPSSKKNTERLGDLETGILWNAYQTERLSFSTGLGMRWPTGSFKNTPQAFRPKGAGMYEIGLRWNFDYQILEGLWLSYQDQLEIPLSQSKRRVSSIISPEKLLPQETFNTYTKSPSREAFVKVNFGFGSLIQALDISGAFASFVHRSEGKIKKDGEAYMKQSSLQSASLGFYVDGRDYGIPFGVDVERRLALSGKDVLVAQQSTFVSFKMYAKF